MVRSVAFMPAATEVGWTARMERFGDCRECQYKKRREKERARTFQPPLFSTMHRNGVSYFLAIQNAHDGTPNKKDPSPVIVITTSSSSVESECIVLTPSVIGKVCAY